jgi:hypothetical protein
MTLGGCQPTTHWMVNFDGAGLPELSVQST